MSNRPDYKISCTVKTKPEYLAFVFLKNQISKNGDNVSVTGKTALRRGNSNASWSNYNDISALTVGNFSSGNTREVFVALQW